MPAEKCCKTGMSQRGQTACPPAHGNHVRTGAHHARFPPPGLRAHQRMRLPSILLGDTILQARFDQLGQEACQRVVRKTRMPSSCRPWPNPKGLGGHLPVGGRRRTTVDYRAMSSSTGRRHIPGVHWALSSTGGRRNISAVCKAHLSSMCRLGSACEDRSLTLRQADGMITSSLHSPTEATCTPMWRREVRALVLKHWTQATPAGAYAA